MKYQSLQNFNFSAGIMRLIAMSFVAMGLINSANAACVPSATVTCIADQPIQSTNVVKPNIMFILDNSGSMSWDYMPDQRSGTNLRDVTDARRRNFQYNTVYYNPNINYTAALPKRPNSTTGAIETMTSRSLTAACIDGFSTTDPCTTNLSTSFRSWQADSIYSKSADTARPAFYCKLVGGATVGASPCNRAGYQYVAVSATSCVVSGDVTTCPTGADERVNFANWYSYFRTRRLMMRAGVASAFAPLDDKFRVGFYTINSPNATITSTNGAAQNIDDFSGGESGTPKGDWYTRLFLVGGTSSTPLQTALDRIGQYYSGTAPTALSGDPVQYSCQKNFAILSTDGYWNQTPPNRGNLDRTVPNPMPLKEGSTSYNSADTGLTEGAAFPAPFYEGSTATNNTLADIAMYYWVRDLRTTGTRAPNNVPAPAYDPARPTLDTAYWQHMTTYTIGLGVDGTMAYPGALPTTNAGWSVPPAGGDTPETIDDLWHAAVNGHGQYYKANDPTTLTNGLNSALKSIVDTMGYGVGPASSTNDFKSPDQTDYTTYEASYRIINWSGDMKKYNLDRSTGLKTGGEIWSAARRLDAKVNPGLTSTVNPTAYTTRNIVTRRDDTGSAVAFTYATLSPAQQTALCFKASPGTGPCIAGDTSLVDFLRGNATHEGDYGTGKRFRNRHDATETTFYKRDLLGTIVNAQPAYVAAEQRIYQDITDPGYSAFKASTKLRSPVLYTPANDGMLHAFNAANGDELWAYVPSLIIPTGTDDDGRETGMRALSYQDGGAPAYKHHFYIDASPEVGAVDFQRTGGPITVGSPSGSWRNILVGGLGKGGKGYYALDVTTPATTLTAARGAVLWEFPSAANSSHSSVISGGLMGYSYGKPIIAKIPKYYGWVVIVPSGYNNADGYGYLFVLNAQTGTLLETLRTTAPAPGLAKITTLVKSSDKVVTQVYGGDLNGNLWRFDFGDPALSPRVAQIFSSDSSTPITSEPTAAVDPNSGERWIFFGTGKYFDVADRGTTGTQYLVALRDGNVTTPNTSGVVSLTSLTNITDLMTGISGATDGWRYALPNSGERVVNKPVADLRTVVFSTLVPTTDPCSPGLAGYAYGLEYNTGKSRLTINGVTQAYIYSATGISAIDMQTTGKSTGSSGSPQVVIHTTDGKSARVGLDTRKINSGTRHVGWRELLNEY